MGGGRWTSTDWNTYSSANVSGKTTAQVFTSSGMDADFDPALIQVRESRDSKDNPASIPIILGCDVTASMGIVADTLIRSGLDDLATAIQAERQIGDPHVMVMAIGDANSDKAPLQVTQFEADIRIAQQTSRLWLEKGGGINGGESYPLAHLFAANKIVSDARQRRGRKGYLFTIGDEPPVGVTKQQAKSFLGIDIPNDMTPAECATLASEDFHVFHVILVNEGYSSRNPEIVLKAWERALPGGLILLEDIAGLSDAILAAIRIADGARKTSVSESVVVANAVRSLTERTPTGGVARLT
jgi:hypothetical protein